MGEVDTPLPSPAEFRTTRWSVVAAAGAAGDDERRRALGTLCEAYWYPVYAFARRRSGDADAAADRVQGFFARLLEKEDFSGADAARGRFRDWLLGAFKHFDANERAAEHAVKRGGAHGIFSLDGGRAEERFRDEPATDETPEALFERAWARTLLEEVVQRLRREYEERDRGAVFARLEGTLLGGGGPGQAEMAAELGISEGALKVAAHRLRKRFGELLRLEVRDTLGPGGDVEDELRGLLTALSGKGA